MPSAENSGGQPLPIDSPERRRLPPLLRRAWFSLNQAFRRRITHLEITPDQFTVLRILSEGDPKGLSQRQLAEMMSSDPNTVASLVDRMETNGMVRKSAHETDRRANRVQMLANGRRVYQSARTVAIALQEEVLAVIPEANRDAFLAELATVADACRMAADLSIRQD